MANKNNNLLSFLGSLIDQSYQKQLLFIIIFSLALFYPGHNFYQTISINPGDVKGIQLTESLKLSSYPINDGIPAPELSAKSIVIKDLSSRSFIYTKNPNTQLYPASTTKIMTALVALDHFKDLNQTITITNESRAIGHEMGLVAGETITIRSLLYGLLVESGNDAAFALANNYPGGYENFVSQMNAKAQKIGLERTVFKNPSGVEQVGHVTTARDLSVLASYAARNPVINSMMQTKSITVTDISGNIIHNLNSTNLLLGRVDGVLGMKTGWTENAGECLVTYVNRNNSPIIVVVLNSQDRFGESERLIEWIYSHHTWSTPEIDISYNN